MASEKSSGRPLIPIDWVKVDNLLISGCRGVETAAVIGVHPDTLYSRVVEEKGMSFTDYSAEKRQKGDALLRAQQYAKALGHTKSGDNMMLIWLGKNRLGQTDGEEKNGLPPNQKQLDQLIEGLNNAHVNESKTNSELPAVSETNQLMDRSSKIGKDVQFDSKTDSCTQEWDSWGCDDHWSEQGIDSTEHSD